MVHKAQFYEKSSEMESAVEQYKIILERFPDCDFAIRKVVELGSYIRDIEYNRIKLQFDNAVNIVLEEGRVSTSFLQRKLSIGYATAARLIDMMEERGICSPAVGNRPRKVYKRHQSRVADTE
jgi:hypothetical protein